MDETGWEKYRAIQWAFIEFMWPAGTWYFWFVFDTMA
jgi:hypothetical protein